MGKEEVLNYLKTVLNMELQNNLLFYDDCIKIFLQDGTSYILTTKNLIEIDKKKTRKENNNYDSSKILLTNFNELNEYIKTIMSDCFCANIKNDTLIFDNNQKVKIIIKQNNS